MAEVAAQKHMTMLVSLLSFALICLGTNLLFKAMQDIKLKEFQ